MFVENSLAVVSEATLALLWLISVRNRLIVARAVGLSLAEMDDLAHAPPPPDVAASVLRRFACLISAVEEITARLDHRDGQLGSWLQAPNVELEGRSPLEILGDPEGVRLVLNLIESMPVASPVEQPQSNDRRR